LSLFAVAHALSPLADTQQLLCGIHMLFLYFSGTTADAPCAAYV
jgi:hypothetical protein